MGKVSKVSLGLTYKKVMLFEEYTTNLYNRIELSTYNRSFCIIIFRTSFVRLSETIVRKPYSVILTILRASLMLKHIIRYPRLLRPYTNYLLASSPHASKTGKKTAVTK